MICTISYHNLNIYSISVHLIYLFIDNEHPLEMNTITEYTICPSDKCLLVIGGPHIYGGNVPYRVNFLRKHLFLQINVPIGYKVVMYRKMDNLYIRTSSCMGNIRNDTVIYLNDTILREIYLNDT
jgi:hypothetical protein